MLGALVALGTLASVGPTFAQDDGGGSSDSGAAATTDTAAAPAADPALPTDDPLLTTPDPFAESNEGGLAGSTVASAGPVYAVGGIR